MIVVGYLKRACVNLLSRIQANELPPQAQPKLREVFHVKKTGQRRVDQI